MDADAHGNGKLSLCMSSKLSCRLTDEDLTPDCQKFHVVVGEKKAKMLGKGFRWSNRQLALQQRADWDVATVLAQSACLRLHHDWLDRVGIALISHDIAWMLH